MLLDVRNKGICWQSGMLCHQWTGCHWASCTGGWPVADSMIPLGQKATYVQMTLL